MNPTNRTPARRSPPSDAVDGADRSLAGFTQERRIDLVLFRVTTMLLRTRNGFQRLFKLALNPMLRRAGRHWVKNQEDAAADWAAFHRELVRLPTAAVRRVRRAIEGVPARRVPPPPHTRPKSKSNKRTRGKGPSARE